MLGFTVDIICLSAELSKILQAYLDCPRFFTFSWELINQSILNPHSVKTELLETIARADPFALLLPNFICCFPKCVIYLSGPF